VRTCHGCGQVYTFNLNGCVCEYCVMEIWLDDVSVKAYERFCFWMERKDKYVVLDVETTGLDDNAEIVEIALVDLDETVLFHSLVRPERAIPAEATDIHGISDEMVVNAPPWHEVWTEIRHFFASRTALIFNEGFDTRMVYIVCRRSSLPVGLLDSECVMEAYARYVRSYSSKHRDFTWVGLHYAAEGEGVTAHSVHRALGDSLLTSRLIRHIAESQGVITHERTQDPA
jgi:DNA polymerase III subunit epsilon